MPEVISEGNSQADWNAWEDSMTSLDNQLQRTHPVQRKPAGAPRSSKADAAEGQAQRET